MSIPLTLKCPKCGRPSRLEFIVSTAIRDGTPLNPSELQLRARS